MTQELANAQQLLPKTDALMLDDLIPTKENAIVSLQTGRDFDELSVASQRPSIMTEAQALGSAQRKKAGTSSLSKFQRSPSAPKNTTDGKQSMQTSQLAKPSPRRLEQQLTSSAQVDIAQHIKLVAHIIRTMQTTMPVIMQTYYENQAQLTNEH